MTISGGGASKADVRVRAPEVGSWMSGCFSKRASSAWDCAPIAVVAVRAFLTGRRDRGSADVGTDSGIGSDIVREGW